MGRDHGDALVTINQRLAISIHSPRMGRDNFSHILTLLFCISIHSPRMGRDLPRQTSLKLPLNFNPLSPHGERHTDSVPPAATKIFQSTLPAWGETRPHQRLRKPRTISIHSPRMGRDRMFNFNKWGHRISIHSPRMGRDRQVLFLVRLAAQFQSTLPAWGETYFFTKSAKRIAFQSTLPAWGETYNGSERYSDLLFQSTLPAWGETTWYNTPTIICPFQSTLPAWGETVIMMATTVDVTISIHSPRMGRDVYEMPQARTISNFNPLSPHGERPKELHYLTVI